jgi:hypothetical protein
MRLAGLALILLLSAGSAAAQTSALQIPPEATDVVPPGTQSPATAGMPAAQAALAYCIIIENRTGGMIRMVEPPAQYLLFRPGIELGTVLQPASYLEQAAFAGGDTREQQVVATSAVDQVRLRLYADSAAAEGGYLALLPQERRFAAADGAFESPLPSAIYTDMPAGTGLFGGTYPLIAGNPVMAYHGVAHADFSRESTALTTDDLIVIEVRGPAEWPAHLDITNEAGAKLQLQLVDGTQIPCGFATQVLTAPFALAGAAVAQPGAISTAGDALLAIACLPGQRDRLEIAPLGVAIGERDPELPPRLLVANGDGFSPVGQPPLFSGYLYPLSGLETPRRLPWLRASVRLGESTNWLPLAEVVVPESLQQIKELRLSWEIYDPQQAAAEQEPALEQLTLEPPPSDVPGFRLGEDS